MFDFIDKLRKKSPATKKMIALTVSASITGIIFFVWLSAFWIAPTSSESKNGALSGIITPLSSIKDNVAGVYSNFVRLLGIRKTIQDGSAPE